MTQDQTIQRALKILERRIRDGPTLASPEAVRDYLRLLLRPTPTKYLCASSSTASIG